MKFLAPVTALVVLIFGLVHGQDIILDKWCADNYGNVGKPWAICGQANWADNDPRTGILTWSVQPQSNCNLAGPIPFCCQQSIRKRVENNPADKPPQVDGAIMLDECHRLA
ncbi:hypothetical protein PGT21_012954 [Puccinia graminis f. sp. tritici]|uniref:Hydrophobin n=1 Tax=Puccinia graminis f. sp. tritici TaxID=56615 RepID=A0A5B0RWQ6_PUCGR|nr:hypothetical protein PGT21_012954 [Puccinia graminis f. sp. tritici]KAA1129575.1 hypothetical protein PGTUg99_030370 [Puccinia graminis f. sp. tritici]